MSATATATDGARARPAFAALCVFVLLIYAIPDVWLGLGDVGLAKIAAAAALGALGISWLLYGRRLYAGGVVGALLAIFYAWIGASATWSLWPALTADSFFDGLKYLAIFFLLANVVDDRRRAITTVMVVAWASAIPAIGAIDSWVHGEHLVEGDRAGWVGLFANPNDLAHYLVVGMALALGGRDAVRARSVKLAGLGLLALLGTAILLTQSRGGMLAAATVIGLWALRGAARGRAAVGVAAMVALAVQLAPETTWRRAETAFDYQTDASAQGRIDAWRTGLNVARDRPLTGVGAGAFALAWPEFAPGDAGPPRSPHNTFIQLLGETGLPSLGLFAAAVGWLSWRLGRVARGAGEIATLARAVQVGLAGFVVCSLTGGYAYSWPLYLLLGLGVALDRVAAGAAIEGGREPFSLGAETWPQGRPHLVPSGSEVH